MEGEIAKATAALVTALEHGSAHSAGELYADDATLLAPGCEPIRGRTSIEAYWATGIRLGLSALAFERHVLKALGGQAIDAGRYTISIVSDAAGPVAEHGTYLVLYRQVAEGSWRRDIEIFSASSLPASATQAPPSARTAGMTAAGPADDGMLNATFTDTDVSVTPGAGMVELILTGTGTVQGFGAATDVVGVVEDFAASPCGPGGASNSAQTRIAVHGGVLELHEAAMNCVTASGSQVTGTYHVDGRASTGIFARARGTGHVNVDVATGQDTLSGTLILTSPEA